MAANFSSKEDDFMAGPVNQGRIIIQTCLLVALLVFGFICQGTMVFFFFRFKSLRCLSNYLLIDLTIVEFLDISVNIPLFIQYFLFTKKAELSKQKRWFTILFHRFFLLNNLFTQLALIIDCFLAIKFGKRFTPKKSTVNTTGFIVLKWAAILGMLIVFSKPEDATAMIITEEAYQRVLFGPNQTIWKIVIPCCLGFSIVFFLMTNRLIRKSRFEVTKRYGMRVFGRSSRNSSKAVTTLLLILVIQTLSRLPATVYSYLATDSRIEHNRWFAFFCYFFLFLASSILPIIYCSRSKAFGRALKQIKHPFRHNAYLDYTVQHGLKQHRNGRSLATPRGGKEIPKQNSHQGHVFNTTTEQTKDTDVSSKSASQHSLHSILAKESFPDMLTKRSFIAANEALGKMNSKDLLHEKKRNSSRRCFSDSKMFEMRTLQASETSNSLLDHQDFELQSERRFSDNNMALDYGNRSDNEARTQLREYYREIQKEFKVNKTPVLEESSLIEKTSSDKDVQLTCPKMNERNVEDENSEAVCASPCEKVERSPLLDAEDGVNFFHSEKTDVLDEDGYESGDPDVFDTKL